MTDVPDHRDNALDRLGETVGEERPVTQVLVDTTRESVRRARGFVRQWVTILKDPSSIVTNLVDRPKDWLAPREYLFVAIALVFAASQAGSWVGNKSFDSKNENAIASITRHIQSLTQPGSLSSASATEIVTSYQRALDLARESSGTADKQSSDIDAQKKMADVYMIVASLLFGTIVRKWFNKTPISGHATKIHMCFTYSTFLPLALVLGFADNMSADNLSVPDPYAQRFGAIDVIAIPLSIPIYIYTYYRLSKTLQLNFWLVAGLSYGADIVGFELTSVTMLAYRAVAKFM
jgi:hypothetical protein